jgi:large conductance mechanosensitive channel
MSIIKEFKEFALRGNVVDMAVGIVIGAAFGKIVTSLVNDVVMPPLGALMGGVDFSDKTFLIPGTEKVMVRYGAFLSTVLDFLIVALAIFAVIKLMNMVRHQPPATPPPPPKQEVLLTEIRDLLKSRV